MTSSRLYINSYLMQKTGSYDDTEFEITLGDRYSDVSELSLDTAVLDNQWVNFYESGARDFRNVGVDILGTQYRFQLDRYVTWT